MKYGPRDIVDVIKKVLSFKEVLIRPRILAYRWTVRKYGKYYMNENDLS